MVKAKLTFRNLTLGKRANNQVESAFLVQTAFNSFLPFIGGMVTLMGYPNTFNFFLGIIMLAITVMFQLSVVPVDDDTATGFKALENIKLN